jgi:hypothetical protein
MEAAMEVAIPEEEDMVECEDQCLLQHEAGTECGDREWEDPE